MPSNDLHTLDTEAGGERSIHGKEGGPSSSSAVPHSPLQSLVQENDLHRRSGQQSYQKHRHGGGSNRDSRDTLERLIGNSFEKVGDNLLLSSRTREGYEEQFEGPPQRYIDERPLTSAGSKNRRSSRGTEGVQIVSTFSFSYPRASLLVCYMLDGTVSRSSSSGSARHKPAQEEVVLVQSPRRPRSEARRSSGSGSDRGEADLGLRRSSGSGLRSSDFVVNGKDAAAVVSMCVNVVKLLYSWHVIIYLMF